MTTLLFANLDGTAREASRTVSGRRLLSAVVREAMDFTRPFMVAVFRRPDLDRFGPDAEGIARFVSRPPEANYYLEAEWPKTRLGKHDVVTFVFLPAGGGGGGSRGGGGGAKNGMAIGAAVAAIALAVIAPYAIPAIAGAIAPAIGVSLAAAKIGVTVLFAGAVLGLNYVASRASKPKSNKEPETRPLTGVSGGGNLPRPGARIPVGYGRYWTTPELSQPDYFVSEGENIRLFKRMTIGCGKYSIKKLRVGNAVIWDNGVVAAGLTNNLQVEIIQPGALSALVPGDVYSSPDVAGIELPRPGQNPEWAGPHRVSPQGIQVKRIQLDFSAPNGVYVEGSGKYAGNIYAELAGSTFEYAPADANGNPAGPWVTVPTSQTYISGASRQPQRRTIYVDVAPGEYLVRAKNTSGIAQQRQAAVSWDGLRGIIGDTAPRPEVTEIAISVLSGPGLSITGFGNVEAEVARVLPCRRGGVFVEQESSKALDALVDSARNTAYGGKVPDAAIDYTKIEAYLSGLTEFDTFDGQINGPILLWEAWGLMLGPMRAEPQPSSSGGLTFARDEPKPMTAHFTRREILSGTSGSTTSVDRLQSATHVRAEYTVAGDPRRPQEALAAYGPENFATSVSFPGVVAHAHATHLARWTAAVNFYRYERRQFDLELNHRLIAPGDVVGVDTWYLADGAAAGVEAHAGLALTLDCDIVWPGAAPAPLYAALRDTEGKPFGPILCTLAGRTVTLDSADLAAAETAAGKSLAAALGPDIDVVHATIRLGGLTEVTERWIVQSIQPKSWGVASIEVVNDAPEVWSAIGAAMPPAPAPPSALALPDMPTVQWVRGTLGQDGRALRLSWACHRALGAVTFEVEASWDAEDTWTLVSRGAASEGVYTAPQVDEPMIRLRSRGIGQTGLPGPWVYGETPSRQVENPVTIPDLFGDTRNLFVDVQEQLEHLAEQLNLMGAVTSESLSANRLRIIDLNTSFGQAAASISQVATTLATLDTAFAELSTNLEATFGANAANVDDIMTAVARGDLVAARTLLSTSATAGLLASFGQLEIQSATDGTTADALIKLLVRIGQTGALTEAGLIIRAIAGNGQSAGHVTIKGDKVTFEPSTAVGGQFILDLANSRLEVWEGAVLRLELGLLPP